MQYFLLVKILKLLLRPLNYHSVAGSGGGLGYNTDHIPMGLGQYTSSGEYCGPRCILCVSYINTRYGSHFGNNGYGVFIALLKRTNYI